MSTTTLPIDSVGHEKFPLSAISSLPEHIITQLKDEEARLEFLGRLIIPRQPFSIPKQAFVLKRVGDQIIVESQSMNSWPKIHIEFSSHLEGRNFELHPSENTVDAWLLYTRVSFLLAKAGEFSIPLTGLDDEIVSRFELELDKGFFQLARVCRKLKFIENIFNVKFALSDVFPLTSIEFVFRGITEGEFSVRAANFTFPAISPSDIDLTKPPFEGCGPFCHRIEDLTTLFGEQLSVGPVTVHLEKAELASPKVVEHIRKGLEEPIDVRFEVLDNQIVCRFEDYVRQPRERLTQKLEQFKQQLARKEPKELVNLVTESLQSDVSSEEANQIAVGWQFYNQLPDRFCPQDPEVDPATGHWRVPVWLVYTGGEGGPVGEIIIDKKTGVIIHHTPIEEMRSQASSLVNEYDEEVLTTARKFMDRHDKLLRRLAE